MSQSDRELDRILAQHFSESPSPRAVNAEDDREFEAEMRDLLAEGEEAVFAGIDPQIRKRVSGSQQRRAARWIRIGAGLAACVLLCGVLVTRSWRSAPNAELTFEVRGGFSDQRGDSRADAIPRYGPDNDILIHFVEKNESTRVNAQIVRAFSVDSRDRLSPLPVRITRVEDDATTTFDLEGRAGALFGAISGTKTLAIGFATRPEDLQSLSGATLDAARDRDVVRWVILRVEFIRPTSSANARILRYARLIGAPGQTIPVFTRFQLPRVQVRGSSAEPWALQIRVRDRAPVRVVAEKQERSPYLLLDISKLPPELMEAGEVELVLGDERVAKWSVLWATSAEDDPAIKRARKEVADDDHETALEILERAAAGNSWAAYHAQLEIGRVHLKQGATDKARQSWQRAYRTAMELGSATEAAARLRACAYLDLDSGEFERAASQLSTALSLTTAAGDEHGTARAQYLQAQLLQKRNIPNASLLAQQQYSELLRAAHERGDDEEARSFAMLLATALAEQGSMSEAQQLLLKYRPEKMTSRIAVDYALNTAYVERLAFESQGRPSAMASPLRDAARDLLQRLPADARPNDRALILSDVIRYALALGDLAGAEESAAALRNIAPNQLLGARWDRDLILAEVDLRAGRIDRLEQHLREVQGRAETEAGENVLDVSFIAETLIAETKLKQGNRKGAEATFRAALRKANELARLFAAPRSRESYRSRRSETERRLAQLLIEDGRAEDALMLIEESRARAVAELAAQVRVARAPHLWREYLDARTAFDHRFREGCPRTRLREQPQCAAAQQRVEDLLNAFYVDAWTDLDLAHQDRFTPNIRRFPPDTGLLSIARSPAGLLTFWARGGTVRAAIVSGDPIAPWDSELENMRRVYLSTEERRVLEELPLRISSSGEPLGAHVEMVALAHGARRNVRLSSGSSLIVADPLSNLPEARREGAEVAARASNANLYVGEDADRGIIQQLATRPSLFHFSGHGSVPSASSWSAQLELFGSQTIRVQDVLAERLAAELVVLNGCATGAVDKETSFGLPEAFIASDAHYVLATVTDVSDSGARRFMNLFYEFGGLEDPPAAFRQAFAQMWRMGEHVSFRLWGNEG